MSKHSFFISYNSGKSFLVASDSLPERDGSVYHREYEQPMKYHAGFEDSYLFPTFSDEDWEEVDIPHNPTPFPFHDGDEKKVWTIGTYRKTVSLPAKPGWERVARFEGVGVDALYPSKGRHWQRTQERTLRLTWCFPMRKGCWW
jgi:hypothetical protein